MEPLHRSMIKGVLKAHCFRSNIFPFGILNTEVTRKIHTSNNAKRQQSERNARDSRVIHSREIPNEMSSRLLYLKDTKKQTMTSSGVYCIQFDLSSLHSVTSANDVHLRNFESVLRNEADTMKPNIIYLQQTDQHYFSSVLSTLLKGIGYHGYFQHEVDGKGQATFYRIDTMSDELM